jgi:hypothetical protein
MIMFKVGNRGSTKSQDRRWGRGHRCWEKVEIEVTKIFLSDSSIKYHDDAIKYHDDLTPYFTHEFMASDKCFHAPPHRGASLWTFFHVGEGRQPTI